MYYRGDVVKTIIKEVVKTYTEDGECVNIKKAIITTSDLFRGLK